MKMKCVFVSVVLISFFIIKNYAQSNSYSFIPSQNLAITFNKTTNLIFPYQVQSIDRGSKDILVQQPKGTENIVQVKAGKPNFTQTNLSVVTVDGKLYSFTVDYIEQPAHLNIIIGKDDSNFTATNAPVTLATGYNEALIKSLSEKIFGTKAKHGKAYRNYQMKFQLSGMYINHDVLYFRLLLRNNSNISYDANNIDFTIKDRQKSKRTAVQDLNITPLYTYHAYTNVAAESAATCVVALSKFTLPYSKYLSIQVLEKNGGRNLRLDLQNKDIMKAKLIR